MSLCPSCNYEKELDDKTLCFYCYYRGNESTMKMIILDILNNSAIRLNKNEILENINSIEYLKDNHVKIKDLETLLLRYKSPDRKIKSKKAKSRYLKLISGRKSKIKTGGRSLLTYSITIRGKKWLAGAKKKWLHGYPIHVPRKNKNELKFKMINKYLECASSIRGRIGKVYDIYAYIFPRRRML